MTPPHSVSTFLLIRRVRSHSAYHTGIAPWQGEIHHPLLVVNSEEYAVGQEYAIFKEQVARTVKDPPHVYTIRTHLSSLSLPPLTLRVPLVAGATHPSFSDVFLILPRRINELTGLKVSAERVIELALGAVADFLHGEPHKTQQRATRGCPGNRGKGSRDRSAASTSAGQAAAAAQAWETEKARLTAGQAAAAQAGTAMQGLVGRGALASDASMHMGPGTELGQNPEGEAVVGDELPTRPVGKIGELVWHPYH